MNCEVNYTAMSMRIRYKHLTVNDEDYLIDIDRPVWVLFIPFAYWLIPHTVYKISNQHTIEQIKDPTVKQTKASYVNIFGIGMTVLLARLLESISGYFDLNTIPVVTFMIFLISALLLISLRLYISKINQRNLYKIANPEKLQNRKLWIWPKGVIHFFVYIIVYFIGLLLVTFGFYAYFKYKNILLLIYTLIFVFFLLFANVLTVVPGTTRVKFKKNKQAI